jgi:hypothetical protein
MNARAPGSRPLGLALALLAATAAVAADPEAVGQVKKAAGTAYLIREGTRLPARVGDPVRPGDAIETGPDGSIGVTLADNTMISAGPDTRMTLEEYRFDSASLQGNLLADLQQGTLAVVSGDLQKVGPDAVHVRTPRAILGVRGTEFLVRADGEKKKKKKGLDQEHEEKKEERP